MPKRHSISWTGPALTDLEEMREYVSRDNPTAAGALAQRIQKKIQHPRNHPKLGRIVPELKALGSREVIVSPYRIVYDVQPRRIVILRVWHGRRELDAE